MLVGALAFILLSISMIVLGIASFQSDDIRESFTGLIKAGSSDLSLVSGALEMALLFAAMAITVKVIHDIMVSIQKENSPFMESNSKGFKLVSVTFLVCSVPLAVLEYLNRDDLVLALCILLACILISVVMYCLTIIFRYGFLLQDESDHTL
jgi:hypothetical protein